jgi:tetratricopeptide (TPR) repeat protein
MKTSIASVAAIVLFVAGIGVGMAAKTNNMPSAYHDKSPQDAAVTLLDTARILADDDSWELIAIGRVHYLGGDKAEGQAIFDALLTSKHEDSDLFRIARVYREAGEWAKAKRLFDDYAVRNPKDSTELAEIGAYYLMQGDRAAAEGLFDRAFAGKPGVWATIAAAGGYLGVAPQE